MAFGTKSSSAEGENSNGTDGTIFDNGSEEDTLLDSTYKQNGKTERLPHPIAASKWRTRELVTTNSLPSYEKIHACQNEIRALGDKALNEEMLLESRNLLTQSIVRNIDVYHWCFYVTVMQLDIRLDKTDVSISFLDKYHSYIKEMKALWILSRGLEAALTTKRYFGYLRRRYVELSADYFGKDLSVISAPLGNSDRRVPRIPEKGATPLFKDY